MASDFISRVRLLSDLPARIVHPKRKKIGLASVILALFFASLLYCMIHAAILPNEQLNVAQSISWSASLWFPWAIVITCLCLDGRLLSTMSFSQLLSILWLAAMLTFYFNSSWNQGFQVAIAKSYLVAPLYLLVATISAIYLKHSPPIKDEILSCVANNMVSKSSNERGNGIWVDGKHDCPLLFESILYVSSAKNYLEFHTQEKVYLHRETLSSMEKKLPTQMFIRCHRSYVVNLNNVSRAFKVNHHSGQLILRNGNIIRIGKTYLPILESVLNKSKLEAY